MTLRDAEAAANLAFRELLLLDPATIAFTITAPSSDPMTDASLAITGSLFSFSGASLANTETLSNGDSLSASMTQTSSKLSDSTNFSSAATSLTVTDNFSVSAAFLESATNQFSETPVSTGVPEPSSLALLGVGLSALALARRRKVS